jgi:hypothetical protein
MQEATSINLVSFYVTHLKKHGTEEDYIRLSFTVYSSPNTIRGNKSRRLRWARHVAYMAVKRSSYRISVERLGEAKKKKKLET